jgi:RNA polymerase sigma-70 factor (ECF subfamily)
MSSVSTNEITHLLRAWSNGDRGAMEALVPLVYQELHRAARRYMASENPGHTLQATALINETYLRLARLEKIDWQNRGHFFAICARLMRRILTDYARSRPRAQGGEKAQYVPLEEAEVLTMHRRVDFSALDDALNDLAAIDERQSEVVQLRFFVGLSVKEIAEVLKVSERTVKQDWQFAKLWLLRELTRGQTEKEGLIGVNHHGN